MKVNAVVFLLAFLLIACDEGLKPAEPEQKSFLNGTIHYKNGADNWPPEDSCFAIRVVAFKSYPPQDIIKELSEGNAYFTIKSLPLFVDSSSFSLEISNSPVELKYIVAAMQYSFDITAQKVVGLWSLKQNKFEPSSVFIEKGKSYSIEIDVDFDSLPPQPF